MRSAVGAWRGWSHSGYFCVAGGPLEDGQPGGGQGAGVDVLGVSGSVQGRFWGTAVDLRQGVLQQLDGGQDLQQDTFVREGAKAVAKTKSFFSSVQSGYANIVLRTFFWYFWSPVTFSLVWSRGRLSGWRSNEETNSPVFDPVDFYRVLIVNDETKMKRLNRFPKDRRMLSASVRVLCRHLSKCPLWKLKSNLWGFMPIPTVSNRHSSYVYMDKNLQTENLHFGWSEIPNPEFTWTPNKMILSFGVCACTRR